MESMTPLGRIGTPEDIAAAALYLCSPAGEWVTGKVFEVDGGTISSNWPLDMAKLGISTAPIEVKGQSIGLSIGAPR